MDLVEGGMGAMVTATANRAVTADTKVMLMRDRAMSSAGDDDYMADPITITAGAMTGSTMVMAVEDNMMEDMEELVLYGMTEGMAGEVTGEVHLHLWDAAVAGPAGHRAAPAGGLPGRRRLPPLSAEVAFGGVGVRNSLLPPLPGNAPGGRGFSFWGEGLASGSGGAEPPHRGSGP